MDEAHLMLLLLKALSALEVRGGLGLGGMPFKRCSCSLVNLSALTSNLCNEFLPLHPGAVPPTKLYRSIVVSLSLLVLTFIPSHPLSGV